MPVVAIAPNDALLEKLKSNLQEVRARGGELYVVADADSHIESSEGIHVLRLPEHAGLLSPIVHTIPLQLLAYHTAVHARHRRRQAAESREVRDGGVGLEGGAEQAASADPAIRAPPGVDRTPMKTAVQFRLRIRTGDEIAVGPGKIELLEMIAETGSITAAAKRLGMSYRRAWLLVDTMNRCFKGRVVETEAGGNRGGGTQLTALGARVVRSYRRIEDRAAKAGAAEIAKLTGLLAHGSKKR